MQVHVRKTISESKVLRDVTSKICLFVCNVNVNVWLTRTELRERALGNTPTSQRVRALPRVRERALSVEDAAGEFRRGSDARVRVYTQLLCVFSFLESSV